MHILRKLRSTLSILATLFMARTFGRYEHTVFDGDMEYARYVWRGEVWAFPTTAMEPRP